MKSTHFDLTNPIYGGSEYSEVYERPWAKFEVPTLPAYSIINHTIDGTRINVDAGTFALKSEIIGSCVKIHDVDRFKSTFFPSVPVLTIYHFGIRDYSLLFPSIKNDELRTRVGCFMEEADKTFEQGAWLSFVVMACGVFEGVLADIVDDHKSTFGKILKTVEEKSFLDNMEFNALTLAKDLRNLIHAGKFEEEFVNRKSAMDIRVQLDRFIKNDWSGIIATLNDTEPSKSK